MQAPGGVGQLARHGAADAAPNSDHAIRMDGVSADSAKALMMKTMLANAEQRQITQTQKEENLEANVRSHILDEQRSGRVYCVFDGDVRQEVSAEDIMTNPTKRTLATYLKRRTDVADNTLQDIKKIVTKKDFSFIPS